MWSDDLSDFLSAVDVYEPTVPREIIKHYMETAGVTLVDDRVVSIVALACDKFMVDTIHECKQMGKIRNSKVRKSRKVHTNYYHHIHSHSLFIFIVSFLSIYLYLFLFKIYSSLITSASYFIIYSTLWYRILLMRVP